MTNSAAFSELFCGADLKVTLNSDNEEGVPECTPVWNETFNCHISLWRQTKRIKDVENVEVCISVCEGHVSKPGSRIRSGLEMWRFHPSVNGTPAFNKENGVMQHELVSNNHFFDSKVYWNTSGIGQLLLIDGEASFKLTIDRGACTKNQRVKEGTFTVSCSLLQGAVYGEAQFYLTRYFLKVVNEDEGHMFYKNEDGDRKYMFCDVEFGDSLSKKGNATQILPEIPVRVALYYESGLMPASQSPLNVFNSLDGLKVNPHDRRPLRIKYRIEEVSKKPDVMKFKVKVFSAPSRDATSIEITTTRNKCVTCEIPTSQLHSMLGFIKPCFTSPIKVLSKQRGPSVVRSKKLVEVPRVLISSSKQAATIPAVEERIQKRPNLVRKELTKDKRSDGMSSVPHPMGNRGGESAPALPMMQSLSCSESCASLQSLIIEILSAWMCKAVPVFDELQWHTVGWRSSDSEGNTNGYRVPIRQCPSCHVFASDEPRCESYHKSNCSIAEVINIYVDIIESELFDSFNMCGMVNGGPTLKRAKYEHQ
eukprot:365386_1